MSQTCLPWLERFSAWLRDHHGEKAAAPLDSLRKRAEQCPPWLGTVLSVATGFLAVVLLVTYWPLIVAAVAGGAAYRYFAGK